MPEALITIHNNQIMENEPLITHQQEPHVEFGDYEMKGQYGIWLSNDGKKYVLFPSELVSMLLHIEGKLTASCKDGDIWNGNTVYYSDAVDEYIWILTDYANKKSAYLVFPKNKIHKEISEAFKLLYGSLSQGAKTVYKGNSVNTDTLEVCMKELDRAIFISNNKRYGYDSKIKEAEKLNFVCKHEYSDFPYTLTLGGITLKSYVSDWTTDLTQLRKDLEMAKTIKLFFEDSPTTISFPNCFDGGIPDRCKKELVEITPNEFCESVVIFGICNRYQVIQAIYEGLLRMARYEFHDEEGYGTWDDMDNMTFYNKIKSPLVESLIRNKCIENYEIENRQILIRHILTICPHHGYIYKDEKNRCDNFFVNGKIVIEFSDCGRLVLNIPGFEQWYNDYLQATDYSDKTINPNFDYDCWREHGLQLASQLRQQLPEDIDLWYETHNKDQAKDDQSVLLYNNI